MVASILDGNLVATDIRRRIQHDVTNLVQQGYQPPGLAVVIVGQDPASTIYVQNKRKTCVEVGFNSFAHNLPVNTSENELLSLINKLNCNNDVHGILVQLPLLAYINTLAIIESIDPQKYVDGYHPYNLGRLAQGNPLLRPCTPFGIMTLLSHYNLSTLGKHAVIIGASNIVGRPMALEFLHAKSTVTICHSATQRLDQHVKMADIIVVATGKYDLIDTSWLNHKQILIDVGIHRETDGRIHGDVDFLKAKDKVAWITPVPRGVGPMTIATLLHNTWNAAAHITSS